MSAAKRRRASAAERPTIPRRSSCPVCAALDIFGDKWSLLIVRDIMLFGKTSYGEFLDSPERIATNILANRLALLEEAGILDKTPHPEDKRREIYALTEKGIDLLPVIADLMLWSAKYGRDLRIPEHLVSALTRNRPQALRHMRARLERGLALA